MSGGPGLPQHTFLRQERVAGGKKVHCTTREVMSCNERIKEVLAEIFLSTNKCGIFHWPRRVQWFLPDLRHKLMCYALLCVLRRVIQEVIVFCRGRIGILFEMSDNISLFDVLLSFADLASSNDGFVRPEYTEDGPIGEFSPAGLPTWRQAKSLVSC